MGISVADNFSYLGGKPLDGRIQYATLAAMKAMADATLYEGCEAYCVATDKYYKWLSSNTVDADTGKWREVESGGGSIPVATANTLGGIKVGSGLTITQDGTLSALSAPIALSNVSGVVTDVIDRTTGEVHISWSDPDDIPGETGGYLAQWKQTLVVKKVGSVPTSPSDGTTICTNEVHDQYAYRTGYITDIISPLVTGDTYYRFFPVSTADIVTYGTSKKVNLESKIYGFKITQSQSVPDTRVEYIEDAIGMIPARMDFENGVFNYGDWGNVFFIKDLVPVMLYTDGTEAYKLNPNDLSEKADGTASDITDTSFDGNAMMRVPKVYIKATKDSSNNIYVYISEDKVSNDYECWAHHDDQGNEIPYIYLPIYNGSMTNNKMRSLSGKAPNVSVSNQTQMEYCNANNGSSGKYIWSCTTLSAWMLITYLSVLISKSTDTQACFGKGYESGASSAGNLLTTGQANTRGLFWGSNTASNNPVKIFGLENPYGNVWKKVVGFGLSQDTIKYKLTYGQEDGSTVDGYTNEMTGYKSAPYTLTSMDATLSDCDCIDGVLLPKATNGTDYTKYYADNFVVNTGYNQASWFGGYGSLGNKCGLFAMRLNTNYTYSTWNTNACIECRPRLGEESIVS